MTKQRKPFFKVYTEPELKEKLKYYSSLYGANQSEVINMLVTEWVKSVESQTPLRDKLEISKALASQGGA
ncbi:hypothetical protein [Okeania sp. SIO2B3]|uniref:hypothetical protein n=1 Tax=Okeania sp. SIO2B3 TaxID=2607784 RepID=UPI0013C00BA7|nr:hypothetical protein [Okeania sp. SIO2B3]NET40846.1 hypothetical protein [Okeania sp. SIO2B3]